LARWISPDSTGATILGRNCSMAQIMAVTGHKSASSVAVYQRVSTKEKQVMGDIMVKFLKVGLKISNWTIFRHFTILRHMPRNVFSVHFPTIFS
jgi:hypothetical protein